MVEFLYVPSSRHCVGVKWRFIVCWSMLEYAGGRWRMLEDAGGCWRMLEDAGASRTLEDAGGRWRTLEDAGGLAGRDHCAKKSHRGCERATYRKRTGA